MINSLDIFRPIESSIYKRKSNKNQNISKLNNEMETSQIESGGNINSPN